MNAAIVVQGEAGQRATHLGCAIKDSFTLLVMFEYQTDDGKF